MDTEIMLKVNGVDCPCPSVFNWGLQDISAAESGRTDDTIMHKNRVGQKRKIGLAWNGKNWAETAEIMQMFNDEYIDLTYPDMLSRTYETRTFYVGDKSAPVKWWSVNGKIIEQISFDVIER